MEDCRRRESPPLKVAGHPPFLTVIGRPRIEIRISLCEKTPDQGGFFILIRQRSQGLLDDTLRNPPAQKLDADADAVPPPVSDGGLGKGPGKAGIVQVPRLQESGNNGINGVG